MNKLRFALSLCLLLTAAASKGQYIIKEADKQYESFKYAEATGLYEQAYAKKASLHAAERLGDCYRFNNDYAQAEKWYAIAVAMPGSKADNILYYAKALQNNSRYPEARAQYEAYATANKDVTPEQKNVWLASCDSAISWMRSPDPLTIDNYHALNSGKSDWNAVPYMGGVVFTSDRFTGEGHQSKQHNALLHFDTRIVPDPALNGWTGNDYLHLFLKPANSDSARLFPLNTGTGYHVGSASFTKNGKEIFFTLTRIPGRKDRARGKAATVNIEIYSSKQDASGKWSDPLPFTYNNVNAWSVGDPFITEDGIALYFSSNMPGGLGGTDLYVCYRSATGEWGPPLNLININTPGNERSPALTKDNVLYFASDGRIGMGGLDIYRVVLDRTGKTKAAIKNMRYPLNSPQDDFAFGLTEAGIAYLSSNRGGGVGSDDIYAIAALLKDEETPSSSTALTTDPGITTDTLTGLAIATPSDKKSSTFVTTPDTRQQASDLVTVTSPSEKPAIINTELPDIYFDFNKADIRPDAQLVLNRLAVLLTENPGTAVEIGSHTDSRGNDAFNLTLSEKRAGSVVNYLVGKGVEKKRVIAKGYGETSLQNKCGNAVTCTEEEHSINRRTVFKLVKQ